MEKSPEAFRTIREVADAMALPQHVLRFWETRFPQIRPLKRAGGRRYYRPDDVERLRLIKRLLYDEGYTIKGVQKLFKEQGAQALASGAFEARSPLDAVHAEARAEPRDRPLAAPQTFEARRERPEGPSNRQASGLGGAENDAAALRQILADIRHAERILTQARSQES
jgi:DNA-binding transcriptional MerR regulator